MAAQPLDEATRDVEIPPVAFDLAPQHERRDAAHHRQRILTIARELFAAQGVAATSMHQIACAAEVGQGTLYRRYAHKGALCSGLLAEDMTRFCTELRHTLQTEYADAPALAQLDLVLQRITAFNEASGPLLCAIRDAAAGHRQLTSYQHPLYCWLHATVAVLLRRAVARGEIAALDVACSADQILASLEIALYLHQRQERGYTPEQILAAARRLFIVGIAGAEAGSKGEQQCKKN